MTESISVWMALIVSGLSIVISLMSLGIYKEKIDRHEKMLNIFIEGALENMVGQGKVKKESPYKLTDEAVLPLVIKIKLDHIIPQFVPGDTIFIIGHHIVEVVNPQELADIGESSVTNSLGLCIAYIMGQIERNNQGQVRGRPPGRRSESVGGSTQ